LARSFSQQIFNVMPISSFMGVGQSPSFDQNIIIPGLKTRGGRSPLLREGEL
jgi:hypothetical protein